MRDSLGLWYIGGMDIKNNIILIGLPTSGKSTVGVILAKELGYDFIDGDLLMQGRAGMKLSGIMEERGIDGFLKFEEDIHLELDCERAVVAPGGSVIYGEKAMAHLKEIGTVVYLKMDYSILKRRLRNAKKRGVALRDGQSLRDLYEERIPLYEKYADIIMEERGRTLEDIVVALTAIIRGDND